MTNETDTVEATATVGGSLLEAVVMHDSMQKEYQIENLKREIKDRDAMIAALIMAAGGEILIPTHLLSSMEYRGKTLVRTDTLNGVKYHVEQAYQPA